MQTRRRPLARSSRLGDQDGGRTSPWQAANGRRRRLPPAYSGAPPNGVTSARWGVHCWHHFSSRTISVPPLFLLRVSITTLFALNPLGTVFPHFSHWNDIGFLLFSWFAGRICPVHSPVPPGLPRSAMRCGTPATIPLAPGGVPAGYQESNTRSSDNAKVQGGCSVRKSAENECLRRVGGGASPQSPVGTENSIRP